MRNCDTCCKHRPPVTQPLIPSTLPGRELAHSPQYRAEKYRQFAKDYGFTHVTSSPYYPQGNGEAERAVGTIKRLEKEEDPYLALLAYRSTPLQNGYILSCRTPNVPQVEVLGTNLSSATQVNRARLIRRPKTGRKTTMTSVAELERHHSNQEIESGCRTESLRHVLSERSHLHHLSWSPAKELLFVETRAVYDASYRDLRNNSYLDKLQRRIHLSRDLKNPIHRSPENLNPLQSNLVTSHLHRLRSDHRYVQAHEFANLETGGSLVGPHKNEI